MDLLFPWAVVSSLLQNGIICHVVIVYNEVNPFLGEPFYEKKRGIHFCVCKQCRSVLNIGRRAHSTPLCFKHWRADTFNAACRSVLNIGGRTPSTQFAVLFKHWRADTINAALF